MEPTRPTAVLWLFPYATAPARATDGPPEKFILLRNPYICHHASTVWPLDIDLPTAAENDLRTPPLPLRKQSAAALAYHMGIALPPQAPFHHLRTALFFMRPDAETRQSRPCVVHAYAVDLGMFKTLPPPDIFKAPATETDPLGITLCLIARSFTGWTPLVDLAQGLHRKRKTLFPTAAGPTPYIAQTLGLCRGPDTRVRAPLPVPLSVACCLGNLLDRLGIPHRPLGPRAPRGIVATPQQPAF